MKKFLFIVLAVSFFACSEEEEPLDCCTNIDTGVTVKYVNDAGDNLLEGENGIDPNDITVYHKTGSEWEEYYESNLDSPKGLMIIEKDNEKLLRIFVSTEIVEDQISETKLKFSENDEDIIKTELNTDGNNIIVTKVWYNDNLEWPRENSTTREFTIVK